MSQPVPPGPHTGGVEQPGPAAAAEPGPPAAGERDATLVPLDTPPGRTQWTFQHGGRAYAVFEAADELLVTDNACPHNGGPLADGLVRDGVVTCPWHWYSYELATGRCRTAPGYQLRRYPVVRSGGRLYVRLPPAAPRPSWSQILRAHARGAAPGEATPGGGPPGRVTPGRAAPGGLGHDEPGHDEAGSAV